MNKCFKIIPSNNPQSTQQIRWKSLWNFRITKKRVHKYKTKINGKYEKYKFSSWSLLLSNSTTTTISVKIELAHLITISSLTSHSLISPQLTSTYFSFDLPLSRLPSTPIFLVFLSSLSHHFPLLLSICPCHLSIFYPLTTKITKLL